MSGTLHYFRKMAAREKNCAEDGEDLAPQLTAQHASKESFSGAL